MFIRILGSGAGGGFPQWNCNCHNCNGFRNNTLNAKSRTQSSIAISENNQDWILFNTSPDIRQQLAQFEEAHPKSGVRDTGIKAIVLVDSQIDHTTGLLLLRETDALQLYMTETTQNDLYEHFPVLKILEHYCEVTVTKLNNFDPAPFMVPGFEHIQLYPKTLISESPPYSPNRGQQAPGSNLGFKITNLKTSRSLFYSPGLGEIDDDLLSFMDSCDVILIDGTFWTLDEMILQHINHKLSTEMGHLPLSGPKGLIEYLDKLKNKRKILIHINNTNPILNEDSEQREILSNHGIEVSYDGMVFEI